MEAKAGTTDSGRWQRLDEIFAAAFKAEPGGRQQLLEELCDGDEQLRKEVEEILAATHNAAAQGFLEADVFADGARLMAGNEIAPGTEIGSYRIVREIGRGGMGAVYLAERDGFHQQVALKIIKRGMDTEAIVRRFVMERDVLASLNHPNIARLLDGGTTADGLPFIAMEYVEGEIITAYCDHKRLTIEERLLLFRKVCAAITYAHQNLVVHRDIKPSNILIGPNGEPKLLDFGIAKLLSPDSFGATIDPTATGAHLMTPEYASPEQIRGEKISTSSDIYSLGVLLYELLCGYRPFSFKNRLASEVLQIISERQPPAPSTAALTAEPVDGEVKQTFSPFAVADKRSTKPARLQRRLLGDLDNIVLMALRKEPARRYQSVQQFAEDLRRHLEGLPVVARRATFSYRAAKFVERNRTATAFATLALLAVLAGLSIAIWQAVVARQQWERAERRSSEVRRLTATLLDELQKEVGALPGSHRAQEQLSRVSIEYLDGLAQETNDPTTWRQLSEAHVLLGKQYGYEAGHPDEIKAHLSRALEISRRLVADYPNDLEAKKLLAQNLQEYDFFCETDPTTKVSLNQERVRLREEVVALVPNDPEAHRQLSGALGTLWYLHKLYNRGDEALRYLQMCAKVREHQLELLEKNGSSSRDRDLLSEGYEFLGSLYEGDLNDMGKAEACYRRALTVAESLVSDHPDYRLGWTRLTAANGEIANLKFKQGDYHGALDYFRAGLSIIRRANMQATDMQMQFAESSYMLRIAENLYRTGKTTEGLQLFREAIALHSRVSIDQTPTQRSIRRADFISGAGSVYASLGRGNDALGCFRQAEVLWKAIIESDPSQQALAATRLAVLCITRGDLYAANPLQRREARTQYQTAVEILSKLKAESQMSFEQAKTLDNARQKLLAVSS